MLVVLELIEAGAGRGEQNDVSGGGVLSGLSDGCAERPRSYHLHHSVQLALDLFGRRTNGVNSLDALVEQGRELGVVGVLVLAAEDEVDVAGEGLQGLEGGVDVSGLGVVVEVDAVDGADELEAVLDGIEAGDGGADDLGGDAGAARGGDGGEDVL